MAERKTGAGPRLSGVLERSTPPSSPPATDPEGIEPGVSPVEPEDAEPSPAARGRGATLKKPRAGDARVAKRIKGRTIYLPDDLFERILVQAHRRDRTISEYVTAILERQVPDHRIARADLAGESTEAGAA
jgi:hypothetical protein